mmetsp:Transcript_38859/g.62570  ORF Transcript_38859/g.62570 Transcript_38859/m.62570 type:complete len:892 (+) Transcript_38859:666-3341(+)
MPDRNFFYEFSLLWVFPLALSGFRTKIQNPDRVPPLPTALLSENIVPRAKEEWEKERAKKKPSVLRLVYRLSRRWVYFGIFTSVVQGLVTTVVRPLLIRTLVAELSNNADTTTLMSYVAYLAVALLVEGWSSVSLKHALSDYLGSIWFTCTSSLVHEKAMSISSGVTTMQESALLGNDIVRTYENLRFFSIVIMAFVSLVGGVAVLIVTIGDASVIGLIVMVVVLLLNARIARLAQIAEEEDLEASDVRLSLMTQIIMGIKAIKLSAWEDSFLELIRETRAHEMVKLGRYRTLHQTSVQFGRACPALCAACSFIYMAASGKEILASDLFAALNVFLSLRLPLILLPESITYIGSLFVTVDRLEKYLLLDEVQGVDSSSQQSMNEPYLELSGTFRWPSSRGAHGESSSGAQIEGSVAGTDDEKAKSLHKGISMRKTSSSPEAEEVHLKYKNFSLEDLRIKLPQGSRCAIVGLVGSGKTSLLAAMINELVPDAPSTSVNTFCTNSIGYVPQNAFVLSGTIRDNISLGDELSDDATHMADVLAQSALEEDLEQFPDGLETAVGERGVTLSGGQKHRLAIARALFADPQVLIADDPLAAVDAAVAEHLVESLIINKPVARTVIVALNQLSKLKYFDYVIAIEGGKIHFQGPVTASVLIELQSEAFDHRTESQNDDGYTEDIVSAEAGQNAQNAKESEERHSSNVTSGLSESESHDGELVHDEERQYGKVSSKVISIYCKGMGYWNIFFAVIVGISTYGVMAFGDLWLAAFVRKDNKQSTDNMRFSIVYGVSCTVFLVLLVATSAIFSYAGVRSSRHLHDDCMERILHAPITWFESTPSGRILSRLSSDLGIVDQTLSRFTDNLFQLVCTVLTLVVVVCVLIPPVVSICVFRFPQV